MAHINAEIWIDMEMENGMKRLKHRVVGEASQNEYIIIQGTIQYNCICRTLFPFFHALFWMQNNNNNQKNPENTTLLWELAQTTVHFILMFWLV